MLQAATTSPPPIRAVQDWPCEGGCLIAIMAMEDNSTVGEVEEWFASTCFEVDQRIGEPTGVRWLLQWFDDTPRQEMIRELLPEVKRALKEKEEIQ